MHVIRDLLDQALRDVDGEPAGRADDFSLSIEGGEIFIDSILTGGGVLADDLGLIGKACEGIARTVRRRPLRRASIPWSSVSEIAEHALTVASVPKPSTAGKSRPALSLRAIRRLSLRTADGERLHLVDLQIADTDPATRLRVTGVIARPRHRISWPTSLRPRPRAPGSDWRFVATSSVSMTATALLLDQPYEHLKPMRPTEVTPPPRRIPRVDE